MLVMITQLIFHWHGSFSFQAGYVEQTSLMSNSLSLKLLAALIVTGEGRVDKIAVDKYWDW